MAKKRRVAITGLGMVTPLGHDVASTWQALLDQKSGINKISHFDASGFTTQIAAEVKNFSLPKGLLDKKLEKYCTGFGAYAVKAAHEALQDAGIAPTEQTAKRWGMVGGSGMMTSPFATFSKLHDAFAESGEVDYAKLTSDQDFYEITDMGQSISNSTLALLSKQFNIQGYVGSVHTACASGGQALGLALRALRRGESDYMLVGGFDSMINPTGLSGFCLLGAVSSDNDAPQQASRPFDRTRNGFVLGEGAGFLVLEDYDSAKARGATIYAELAGAGNSLSAYRITDAHPGGDGARQALQGALDDAGLKPGDVDYVNAHGTSTKMNDLSESSAINVVFGDYAKQLGVSSTKSQIGHLIAAAGAVEGVICALAIHHSIMPMTKNLENPDPDCNLDYITEGPRARKIRAAVSNSFGFGGSNSCIAFKAPDFTGGAA